MDKIRWDFAQPLEDTCKEFGLDQNLVRAIIYHESDGNPWAGRFESQWTRFLQPRDYASKLLISPETEMNWQATSWGLMQVMGAVARELGFDEELPQLCLPQIGLHYGCKKLKQLMEKYGPNEADVISAYNQGAPYKTDGGLYRNQKVYVDPVFHILNEFRSLS